MKRKKHRPVGWRRVSNPSRQALVAAGAVALIGTALAVVYLREPKEPKAEPIPQGPIPQPKPDRPPPLLMPTTLGPKVTVAAGLRYGAKVTIAVPEGGESYDVVVRPLAVGESIDVTIAARVSSALTVGQPETCLGVTLGARVAMSADGGLVLERTEEDTPGLCQETSPWPTAPAISIEFDGMDLVVRVDAPALESAYDMRVALTVTEKPA